MLADGPLSRDAIDAPYTPGSAGCGAKSNVCIAKNLSRSAGPIPKARAPFSEAPLLA
jgi:hypothetical protein